MIWAHKELWDLWLAMSSLMVTQEVCPRPGKCVRLVTFNCTVGEARLKHVCSTRGSVIQFVQLLPSILSIYSIHFKIPSFGVQQHPEQHHIKDTFPDALMSATVHFRSEVAN